MTNAARHFTARPDGHGGVRLTMRSSFRDQVMNEIGSDGVARSRTNTDENGDENGDGTMQDIIHVFWPLLPNQTAKLVEQENGTIAVVVSSEPDDLIGNTTANNSGIVGDRRTVYRTSTLGGEARQLAQLNAINKRHYKR